MPKRVRVSKRSRRKKRRYNKKQKYRISRAVHTPLPTKLLVKQKYYTFIDVNPAQVGLGSHFFRAASLYDPDQSGVGHQPRGFDQIMPMYTHFTVIKSKIAIQPLTPANSDGGTAGAYMYAITLQDNYTALGTGSEIGLNVCEYPRVKFAPLPTTYTQPFRKLRMSYNPKKYLSISKPMSDDSLKGTESSNPAEDVGYGVYVWAESIADPDNVRMMVYLEYVSVLTEPKQPISS